jgi:hypothetical protein
MAFKIVVTVVVCFTILGCASKETGDARSEDVSGTYTNSYSAEVIDAETGEVIGTRVIRDTIFLRREGNGYEVSNRKWLQNDYDGNGWVDSMQGEIEPIETFKAEHNLKTGLLKPLDGNSRPPLFLEDEKIYWGEEKALEYLKADDAPN